jgi:hypothetical protein
VVCRSATACVPHEGSPSAGPTMSQAAWVSSALPRPRSEWDAAWMVTLETPRLQLRPSRADDLDHYLQIFSKAPAMAFQMDRGLTREEARVFLQFHIDTWEVIPLALGCTDEGPRATDRLGRLGEHQLIHRGTRRTPDRSASRSRPLGPRATQRRVLWLCSGTRSRNSD